MEKETLNQIAGFFVNLYNDELDKITADAIYEWWSQNWSNWVEDTDEDIYNVVEKTIFEMIKLQ